MRSWSYPETNAGDPSFGLSKKKKRMVFSKRDQDRLNPYWSAEYIYWSVRIYIFGASAVLFNSIIDIWRNVYCLFVYMTSCFFVTPMRIRSRLSITVGNNILKQMLSKVKVVIGYSRTCLGITTVKVGISYSRIYIGIAVVK